MRNYGLNLRRAFADTVEIIAVSGLVSGSLEASPLSLSMTPT